MAVDIAKIRSRMKTHQADKERRESGGGSLSTFGIKPDTHSFIYVCPPHDNMEGKPWVERMQHKREIPKGSKGVMFSKPCMRDNFKQDPSTCPGCVKLMNARKKRKTKNDEWDKKAGQYAPSSKPISQVIDVTSMFDERGEKIKGMRKCFLDFGNHDKCDGCYLADSCQAGLQRYYMPAGVWEDMMQNFDDEGDITDKDAALPIRIKRVGKSRTKTRYSSKVAKDKFVIPEKVWDRILEKLVDLTAIDPKPTEKGEDLKKVYDDFFALKDINSDDDDDNEDKVEVPDCFQDYDENKRKKRNCKECEVKSECKDTSNSTSDTDDDDDEKGSLDKLRSKMARSAKSGKLNRN